MPNRINSKQTSGLVAIAIFVVLLCAIGAFALKAFMAVRSEPIETYQESLSSPSKR